MARISPEKIERLLRRPFKAQNIKLPPCTPQHWADVKARVLREIERTLYGDVLDAMIEGRKKGQALGARANREKGARFRTAIVKLAKEVWHLKPELKDNISATAIEIERIRADDLKQGKFHLGADAIRKHLARARKDGLL